MNSGSKSVVMVTPLPRAYAATPIALVEAAERLLGEHGIEAVSMRQIMLPGRLLLGQAQPIQLASAILFLASPASSYMTGHVMPVDGGYLVG